MRLTSSIDTFDSVSRPLEIPGVLNFIVCHYHLRPGGIRRVIELATPHLIRSLEKNLETVTVTLATGEAPAPDWLDQFRQRIRPASTRLVVEPAWKYISEQRGRRDRINHRIRSALAQLLAECGDASALVWVHNLSIARNLLLAQHLVTLSAERGIPVISHHHDWWFDNRWLRWPELRRCGFRTLRAVASVLIPDHPGLQHVVINQSDWRVLQPHLRDLVTWVPNLMEIEGASASASHKPVPPLKRRQDAPPRASRTARRDRARCWLNERVGAIDRPVWIMPCRLLRRKNVAEALLLARWLRPDACLVTTGPISSRDEQFYGETLQRLAQHHRWQLRLSILDTPDPHKPDITELLALSETILLTSLQEGFGLPYLEAAATGKPLIARILPNIAPDLQKFGFEFPQSYDEMLVNSQLFDCDGERARQQKLFRAWRDSLPNRCRAWVEPPPMVRERRSPASVPFSRLTLTAQMEVLAQPLERSWDLCLPLNPFLADWKERAAAGDLQPTPWPRQAEQWLSGPAYARRFATALERASGGKKPRLDAGAAQKDFMRQKLQAKHLFPLLWSTQS